MVNKIHRNWCLRRKNNKTKVFEYQVVHVNFLIILNT